MKKDDRKLATNVPASGFYYHYKHDPHGFVNNYAYEVLGAGVHTEDDCRPEDLNMVVYRPLYEAFVYKEGKRFDLRPLHMFMENVPGTDIPRFTKITDPKVLEELKKIRNEMYSM